MGFEAANVIGMYDICVMARCRVETLSQFLAPISTGSRIIGTGCHSGEGARQGRSACPFICFIGDFLIRHRERFAGNPRMAQMYRTFDRMDEARRTTVLAEADAFLRKLEAGKLV